jgi:hypothetical protein
MLQGMLEDRKALILTCFTFLQQLVKKLRLNKDSAASTEIICTIPSMFTQ